MANPQSTCPLCQQDNRCTRAIDPDSKSCWCQTATIPATLMSQAREKHSEQCCICQQCADLAVTLATAPK